MQQKTVLIAGTLGSVAVIVSLALMVTLWPEKAQVDRSKASRTQQDDSVARATAVPTATAQSVGTKALPKKGNPSGDTTGTTHSASDTASPLKVEIGQAFVRDPETGKMKEVAYTATVMQVRSQGAPPLVISSDGDLTPAGAGEAQPGGATNSGAAENATSRPGASDPPFTPEKPKNP